MTDELKCNSGIETCKHESGVMIPEQDLDGNYVKPTHMICDKCRFILKKEIT